MRRLAMMAAGLAAAALAAPAQAKKCPADSVQVGPICVDKYEASVWEIAPANTSLIKKVQKGKIASAADLAGTTQRGRPATTTAPPARPPPPAARPMVGNLDEWVAEWVPLSTACPGWGVFSNDFMCLAGASTTGGPGALIRGGQFGSGTGAGVFAVDGPNSSPSDTDSATGFRCAR